MKSTVGFSSCMDLFNRMLAFNQQVMEEAQVTSESTSRFTELLRGLQNGIMSEEVATTQIKFALLTEVKAKFPDIQEYQQNEMVADRIYVLKETIKALAMEGAKHSLLNVIAA